MAIELKQWKLGFLNCGELAHSLICPLLERGILNPRRIWIAETAENIPIFAKCQIPNIHPSLSSCHVATNVDIIFVGFEAHAIKEYLEVAITPSFPENSFRHKLIVSLIPGVACAELAEHIARHGIARPNVQIMRVIPNMPMTVGEGLILYCRDEYLGEQWAAPVVELLSYHGMVAEIDESLMAVAAYGPAMCGPAYVYLMIEAMADGAVKNDLPRDLAIKFVAQVFAGAAKMVLKTGKHPGQLKDEACVPNGAAIDGIHELEVGCIRASLMNAADAAAKKLIKQKSHT